jgi:hypothetical protein
MDVRCVDCARKGSGSENDLRLDRWLERAEGEWLCPACAVTMLTGVVNPTAPPSSEEPRR